MTTATYMLLGVIGSVMLLAAAPAHAGGGAGIGSYHRYYRFHSPHAYCGFYRHRDIEFILDIESLSGAIVRVIGLTGCMVVPLLPIARPAGASWLDCISLVQKSMSTMTRTPRSGARST
jgi:hypothetical protein